MSGNGAPSIAEYAAIGNGRSVALVSREGSIDWLCWPRFDSPSLFAAVLDAERGGFWRVAPRTAGRTSRAYVEDSNVLVTTIDTTDGRIRVIDFMPVCSEDDKKRQLMPEHELLRIVECEAGEVEIETHYQPKADYGRRSLPLRDAGRLGIRLEHGARLFTLRADLALHVRNDGSAYGVRRLHAGERLHLSLTSDSQGPAVLSPLEPHAQEAFRTSTLWWQRWAARCTYEGPYRAHVIRSLLALKLLSYAPSGAIVAAPTTSLPERVGGDLNWDYRFCWLRDASLTVRALYDLGYADDAIAFVSWLLHTTSLTRPELRVLYDVYGELPKHEQVLAHLTGYRSSRPVRIRNAAASQLQLDTYGEVIDAVTRIHRRGGTLDRATQGMLRQFGKYVCDNWARADHGIWEPRSVPQEHTHSRLLCWVALDRLLALQQDGALVGLDVTQIVATRDKIREDVEARGWNGALGTYTQTLGGHSVDASLLLMSWYGFADAAHPRMRQTYERIKERLGVGPGLIYRYEQSHPVGEGAFGICGFWAVDYLARGGGSLGEATVAFEQLLSYANDVGLYGEEVEPASGEPLGNFPQAFTHVGLINAALTLEERRTREALGGNAGNVHANVPAELEHPGARMEGHP